MAHQVYKPHVITVKKRWTQFAPSSLAGRRRPSPAPPPPRYASQVDPSRPRLVPSLRCHRRFVASRRSRRPSLPTIAAIASFVAYPSNTSSHHCLGSYNRPSVETPPGALATLHIGAHREGWSLLGFPAERVATASTRFRRHSHCVDPIPSTRFRRRRPVIAATSSAVEPCLLPVRGLNLTCCLFLPSGGQNPPLSST